MDSERLKNAERKAEFLELASKPPPQVLLITCSDSSISPELILQSEQGDLSLAATLGTMALPSTTAVIQYAVAAFGSTRSSSADTRTAAMKGLMHPGMPEILPAASAWLGNADSAS
ncbi:MAG TPA: carbonic anhydrase [Bryobacteraceae bacterium]|nr:carbonic anhydrase [Bryobacteraceae bacterium]